MARRNRRLSQAPKAPKPFKFRGTYTDWGVRYFEAQRQSNPPGLITNILSLGFGLIIYILFLMGQLQ